jgi:hypothetical protein
LGKSSKKHLGVVPSMKKYSAWATVPRDRRGRMDLILEYEAQARTQSPSERKQGRERTGLRVAG